MNWFRKVSSLANLAGSFVIGMRHILTPIVGLLLAGVCATVIRGQSVPPSSHQTDPSQAQQIELLRAQMQQMRVDFERQMNTMEEGLKSLQSNLPSHPSTSEVPAIPLTGQEESQSVTKAENGASAKQEAVAIVRVVSGTEARDASSEKAELNKKGIKAGKTPLYENVNDEQNLAIQQAKAFEFHGYLRSGAGVNSRGGQQVYFEAPGAPAKYRLGNETDTYGEFVLVNNWVNVKEVNDHAWFHTEILISADTTETAQGDATDTLNPPRGLRAWGQPLHISPQLEAYQHYHSFNAANTTDSWVAQPSSFFRKGVCRYSLRNTLTGELTGISKQVPARKAA